MALCQHDLKITASGGSGFSRTEEKEKGQNCFIPLRSTPQFSQIIHARPLGLLKQTRLNS